MSLITDMLKNVEKVRQGRMDQQSLFPSVILEHPENRRLPLSAWAGWGVAAVAVLAAGPVIMDRWFGADGSSSVVRKVEQGVGIYTANSSLGTINAVSEPAGAGILMDGRFVGVTPMRFQWSAGSVTLILKKNGFLDLIAPVQVVASKEVDFQVSMSPAVVASDIRHEPVAVSPDELVALNENPVADVQPEPMRVAESVALVKEEPKPAEVKLDKEQKVVENKKPVQEDKPVDPIKSTSKKRSKEKASTSEKEVKSQPSKQVFVPDVPLDERAKGSVDPVLLPLMRSEGVAMSNTLNFAYSIQMGAFMDRDSAIREAAVWRKKGYDAYVLELWGVKDPTRLWQSVRLGRFNDLVAARVAVEALKKREHNKGFYVARSDSFTPPEGVPAVHPAKIIPVSGSALNASLAGGVITAVSVSSSDVEQTPHVVEASVAPVEPVVEAKLAPVPVEAPVAPPAPVVEAKLAPAPVEAPVVPPAPVVEASLASGSNAPIIKPEEKSSLVPIATESVDLQRNTSETIKSMAKKPEDATPSNPLKTTGSLESVYPGYHPESEKPSSVVVENPPVADVKRPPSKKDVTIPPTFSKDKGSKEILPEPEAWSESDLSGKKSANNTPDKGKPSQEKNVSTPAPTPTESAKKSTGQVRTAVKPATSAQSSVSVSADQSSWAERTYLEAVAKKEAGDQVGEEALLHKVIQADPNHMQAVRRLARIMVETNRADKSLELLRQVAGGRNDAFLAEEDPNLAAFMAALYQRKEEHWQAIELYEALLKKYPNKGLWQMGMAISLEKVEEPAGALQAYKKALASGELSHKLQNFVRKRIEKL